CQQGSTTPFTF
nr:immunoglobulin light chain junction region [Macaca mulatta]